MMEADTAAINDPLRIKKMEIISREAEAYAESLKVSKTRNSERADSRKRIANAGVNTDAYQDAIALLKSGKTETERQAYLDDLLLCLQALGAKQQELFPELALKAAKDAEKAAAKNQKGPSKKAAAAGETRSKAELDKKTDTDPKSAPKQETGDELIKRVSAEKNAELEQKEGAAALAGIGKKSQSAIAAEITDKAGTNKAH